MAKKTAERILLSALTLFNEQGEGAVTSVDIAMELDISPGNLYYHFKGKEVMVDALADLHHRQLAPLLAPQKVAELTPQDIIYFWFLLLDKLQVFAFLYRSPPDIAQKYAHAGHVMKGLRKSLVRAMTQWFEQHRQPLLNDPLNTESAVLGELAVTLLTSPDAVGFNDNVTARHYQAIRGMLAAFVPRLALPDEALTQIRAAMAHQAMAGLGEQVEQTMQVEQ